MTIKNKGCECGPNVYDPDCDHNHPRYNDPVDKNFSVSGGVGGGGVQLAPFDLPGSADSPANDKKKKRRLRGFYSS